MSTPPPEPRFTWADLDHWADRGLIRPDQVRAIHDYVTSAPDSLRLALPAPAVDAESRREGRAGLNLVTIAYYFGAFMVLLAFTIFLGLQWEELGPIGQAIIACGIVAGLWVVGGFLRGRGYPLAGDLLVLAGTGLVPLATYTVLGLLGLWPESGGADVYRNFYRSIDGNWVILEVASIAAALIAAWLTRFPLYSLLIAFWSWYLSMDMAEALTGNRDFAWGPVEWTIGASVGFVMLAIGVWQQRRRGDQDWSVWFYIFGHLVVLGNLGALALDNGIAFGLLFLVVYLTFVVASVWLQASTYLVFGALGCYAYVSKLAFDVFEGSLELAFGLALVGLLIVLSAVGYQRYARPWLTRRLAPPAGPASAGALRPSMTDTSFPA